MLIGVVKSGLASRCGMQPKESVLKLRKVYFGSSSIKGYVVWNFIWSRADLKLKNRMEFDNSVKVLGVADDAGSYEFLDEFGNSTFRSFFIACDVQDLSAAGFYSQTVRNGFEFLNFFFFLFTIKFRSIL